MRYTSVEKVRQLDSRITTQVPDERIEMQIQKAEAMIDGYLSEVYVTPFLVVPPLIESLATELALVYYLMTVYTSQKPNVDSTLMDRYERLREMLNDILNGSLSLAPDAYPRRNRGRYLNSSPVENIFSYDEPEW